MKNYLKVFNSSRIFRAVCIGDSTTSQEWCHPNWIDWLNFTFREEKWDEDWRKKFINSGRDGAHIEHYLKYFEDEIAFYKPHVVIASIGLNHLFLKSTPDEIEELLTQLFSKISGLKSDLITWSPYAIPNEEHMEGLAKINNVYEKVTKDFEGVYIDIFSEFQKYDLTKLFTFVSDGNEEWQIAKGAVDYLHCNPIGCQIIADKIAKEGFGKELSNWEFGTMELVDLGKLNLSTES